MTWKEKLRRQACVLWWKVKYGNKDKSFSLSSAGIHPHHLLLILPPTFEYFDVARHMIEPLIKHMRPRFITVLVPENFRTWIATDLGARVAVYDPRKKNFLGFPELDLRRKVGELQVDVAVDLMPEFSPYTAALAAASLAPLRISLARTQEPGFFNVFIEYAGEKDLNERYETLLKYV
jgi:hypothetical protein